MIKFILALATATFAFSAGNAYAGCGGDDDSCPPPPPPPTMDIEKAI